MKWYRRRAFLYSQLPCFFAIFCLPPTSLSPVFPELFSFSAQICYINGRIMKKFYVHTTGCKANQWDSYVVSDDLKRAGLSNSSLKEADIVVINACTLDRRR